MAKIIEINFPSGQKSAQLITAYQRTGTDGAAVVAINTEKVDNGNTVVGVSCKKAGENTFQNIIDMEEWKKAKKDLVTLLKGKEQEEGLTYLNIDAPIQMTEDGQHEIALRKDNLETLMGNYEKAFHQVSEIQEVQNVSVVPESAQISVNPEIASITDASSVAPASIQPEINPFESVIQPMPEVSPLNEQVAFQDIVVPTDLNVKTTSEIPSIEPVQMVSPMPEVNPMIQDIAQMSSMENDGQLTANVTSAQDVNKTNSAVVNSYLEKSTDLMNRLDASVRTFNAAVAVLNKEINEIHNEFGSLVKEGSEYHNLAGQTLNKVQEVQAMSSMSGFIPQDNNIVNFPSIEKESISKGRAA